MIAGSFRAMGTRVDVWADDVAGWTETRLLFERMEQAFSRFRVDSELSRVNRNPRPEVPVSDHLGAVLEVAEDIRSATDGLVDVGIGGFVADWGYDRTFEEVTGLDAEPLVSPGVAWTYDPARSVLMRSPEVRLDLGGIAKGWVADLAVENGLALVVSAGGDIRSEHPDTVVPVDDGDGAVAARVWLGRGGLATSSSRRRRWRVAESEVSHLIDPRSGSPVTSPVVTATAVCERAVWAEAAAKTLLLLGAEGLAWADRTPWVTSAAAVWHDGAVYGTSGLEVAA